MLAEPRRGHVIAPLTLRDVREIYELRLRLEPPAAAAAAGRIAARRAGAAARALATRCSTSATRRRSTASWRPTAPCTSPSRRRRATAARRRSSRACSTTPSARAWSRCAAARPARGLRARAEHHALLDALAAGDGAEAERLMARRHPRVQRRGARRRCGPRCWTHRCPQPDVDPTPADTNNRMTLIALPETHEPGRHIDTQAAERAAADLLAALGADLTDEGLRETPRRMAAAYAELLTPQPFRPDDVPQRRGLRRAGRRALDPVPLAVHAPPAAVPRRRARRLPAGRAHPRAVEVRPRRGAVRPRPAGPGAADRADRRLAPGASGAEGRRRRARGRAPVHVAARRAEVRRADRDLRPARRSSATTRAPARSSWR